MVSTQAPFMYAVEVLASERFLDSRSDMRAKTEPYPKGPCAQIVYSLALE